ncbi:MAG: NusG domain II-containing protein [Atopobiaceae bacterium]|nr:NusG domain II-containing protein [Atopobiaceae bacterium]
MQLGSLIQERRATIICAVVVVALLAFLFSVFRPQATNGHKMVALVHDSNGETHSLPLDEDATLVVSTSLGTNTVIVEDGAIRMLEADCPNRTCLQARPISQPGVQIICLPHQLWIEVIPEGEAAGQMDVSLAEPQDNVDLVAQ